MKKTAGLLFFLFLSISFCTAQGFYNSANLVVNGTAIINVKDGAFYNNGTFAAGNGTIILSGTASAAISTIGGSSATTFRQLTIQKAAGSARLSTDIAVEGTLFMQSGNLDLNQHNIDLGNSAGSLLNETNDTRITGTAGGFILKTVDLNAPVAVNPGNIGIAISSSANPGITTIRRGHKQQTSGTGGISINRFFDIMPANNASLNATLQMFYFDDELAGINKNELNFFKSEDAGATWSFVGEDDANTRAGWVLKNSIGQLSRWTLASNITNSLPVTLVSFTAKLNGAETELSWTTEQEENSSYFEIQRSVGGAFTSVLQVPALGNSSTPHSYQATDRSPAAGTDYYRLKQVDANGNFAYSLIVSVHLPSENNFQVYPNPVTDILYLNIRTSISQQIHLQLQDITGKLLSKKDMMLTAGYNLLPWDIRDLATGVYLLSSDKLLPHPIQIIKQKL